MVVLASVLLFIVGVINFLPVLAVLFRPHRAEHEHAPAGLRLQMREYRQVHILKQRSGNQGIDVDLPPAEDVPQQPQLWELPTWKESAIYSPQHSPQHPPLHSA
jgi:protein ImuA